ncbi:MAG: alpha/beta fold hydrolase [Pseudomonadota bacterium]
MKSSKVSFINQQGQTLSGNLETPTRQPKAYVLFAHCFTCTRNIKAARNIARALTKENFAVLRFDFAGLGQSEGDFADTNFSSNVSDLVSAAKFLEQEYEAPKILVGHSLGGAAVLHAAKDVPSSVAVATIGSPADPAHVTHMLGELKDTICETGEAQVQLAGRPFIIKKQFIDDLQSQDVDTVVGGLRKALLIFHAPLDDTVSVDNAGILFQKAKHPKSFVSLDKADHLLSREEDSRYVGQVLAAWATKYLASSEEEQKPLATHGDVVAQTGGDAGFYTQINAGGHTLVADEPASVGGTERGPSPYELVSSGLAACTTMTLQMYARRKKWPLEYAVTHVHHSKQHLEDCVDCDNPKAKIDVFVREIEVTGPLDEAQRTRLLEIAEKCPVHKTLHAKAHIETKLI